MLNTYLFMARPIKAPPPSSTVRMHDVLRHGCRSGGVSLWRNVHESMLLTKQ